PEIGKDRWCGAWKLIKPDGTPLPLDSCPMTIAIKEGRAIQGEEVIIERYDGTQSIVQVYPQPIFGLLGEITGGVNVVIDVTEQKLATKKIEESEHRYHNMIYSSPSLISILKGEDMIIEVANDAVLESWGKGKDVIGKPLLSVMPEIIDQGFDKLLLSVYKTGEPVSAYETPVMLVRDGKEELLHYTFVYQAQYNVDGKIDGLAIIANEVTHQIEAKKLANEQFRQLAELTPEKISSTDAEGNVIYFNQNWLDYTGLSADELKDQGWRKIIHPDDQNQITKHWKYVLSTGNDIEIQLRLLDKNGEYKWHLRRTSTVRDNKGKIVKWITATIEIQKLKEEEQRKGDFVTMLSHELKTPVTSIKGYIQLLLKMVEKEQEIQFPALLKPSLIRIDKLVLKLTSLISDMLDLTRIESNRLELKNELINLNGLVMGVVEDIRHTSPKHTINLYHDFSCAVNADMDKLGQVIINFISNAIKYGPASDVIDITIAKAKKNQVAVSVKDYGIGIDKKEHQKIFDRFYRIEGKSEQNFSGFGIGLFIAHSIIERHGGFISINSEKGKGSIFTFTLPIAMA
ncbi:MAG: PAS domain S-box protein, partial [Pedobacter sp.]|nr:PAS domain S-box protein [Pedobacter sp.]